MLKSLLSPSAAAKFGLVLILGSSYMGCAPKASSDEAQANQNQGIIGGEEMDRSFGQKHGIVGLYDAQAGGICTGTLLANNMIMTAGHCVSNPSAILVIFNDNIEDVLTMIKNKNSKGYADLVRRVDAGAVNPQYGAVQRQMNEEIRKGMGKHSSLEEMPEAERDALIKKVLSTPDTGDIALLHFQGTLPAGYRSAKILSNKGELRSGRDVVLSGYGNDDGVQGTGAGLLRSVGGIKIASTSFSKTEIVLNQSEGHGACHGDSGGPAFVENDGDLLVWGVTSRGYNDPENQCNGQVIYTNALAWSGWIKETTQLILKRLAK